LSKMRERIYIRKAVAQSACCRIVVGDRLLVKEKKGAPNAKLCIYRHCSTLLRLDSQQAIKTFFQIALAGKLY